MMVAAQFVALDPGFGQGTSTPDDKFVAMLSAINAVRAARDIKLDCVEYVDRYFGRGDQLKHYVDAFAASGIRPKFVRQGEDYHVAFEIDYSHLQKVPNSKFAKRDFVV